MPFHTKKERAKRAAAKQAGKRAITGLAAVQSVTKAAKQLNRITEESAPGFKRKKTRRKNR